jgi:hypothetical protein
MEPIEQAVSSSIDEIGDYLLPRGLPLRGLLVAGELQACLSASVLLLCSMFSYTFAQDVPIAFKAERYNRLWERNPFTFVMPPPIRDKPSPFERLFLVSWLNDGGKYVVLVQNADTNQIQRITEQPNQQSLRLVRLDPNPDRRYVDALISNGEEQAAVKFRFDSQNYAGQTALTTAQTQSQAATQQALGSTLPTPAELLNWPKPQVPAVSDRTPAPKVVPRPLYPGLPRVHTEGGPGPATRLHDG